MNSSSMGYSTPFPVFGKAASLLLERYNREKEAGVYIEADVDPVALL
jgi:hypothetical protein